MCYNSIVRLNKYWSTLRGAKTDDHKEYCTCRSCRNWKNHADGGAALSRRTNRTHGKRCSREHCFRLYRRGNETPLFRLHSHRPHPAKRTEDQSAGYPRHVRFCRQYGAGHFCCGLCSDYSFRKIRRSCRDKEGVSGGRRKTPDVCCHQAGRRERQFL